MGKHIPQLDGIRGIAILLVLVWHYVPCQMGEVEPGTSQYLFRQALSLTWSGVDLFFVLSGLLITLSLLDRKDQKGHLVSFFWRRSCRIFPVYFFVLILFLFLAGPDVFEESTVGWLFAKPMPIWSYLTFTQNFLMSFAGAFGANWLSITWSLAVEQQFYLIMPLIIWLAPRRNLFAILLIMALIAPILRIALPGFHTFILLPWRMDSLMTGACLALGVRSPGFMALIKANQRQLSLLLTVLILGVAAMSYRPGEVAALQHAWLAVTYGTLILLGYLGPDNLFGRILQTRVLVWVGSISYGIYMYHQAVSGLLHAWFRGSSPRLHNLPDAAITGFALLVTLICAMASYRWIEFPIIQWSRKLTRRQ